MKGGKLPTQAIKTIPDGAKDIHLAGTRPSSFRETRDGWLILAAVWVASAGYLAWHLRQGWVPPDAGLLAQEALRALHGQIPHLDFIEVYTGGLTYLNAFAFRVFGVSFLSLRIPLFLFYLVWVPSIYFVARRFAMPVAAAGVVLLAVAWSVPNYPEAMPSWYNLFFATWGVLALLCYAEAGKKRWLWIAGLCGGLSFLIKISGLFFVAAALLFFVFREESLDQPDGAGLKRGVLFYRLFVTAGLLLFLAILLELVSGIPAVADYVDFAFPSACLVTMLLWAVWREKSGPGVRRLRRLLAMCLPFIGGALLPVLFFLVWFAKENALAAWFEGTFIRPRAQIQWAGGPPTPLAVSVGLLPLVIVLLLALESRVFSRRLARVVGLLVLAGLLFASWKLSFVYVLIGFALPLLVPLMGVAAPTALHRRRLPRRQQIFLVVAAAVLCALIQFPTPAAIYFNYAAPMVILGLLALLSTRPNRDSFALGLLLIFYLLFALWLHTPGYFDSLRSLPDQPIALRRLTLPRGGGLLGKANEVREYERLIPQVKAHAQGRYIYCAPDCPEVYFLSGKRNPTGTLLDFLDPDFHDDAIRTRRIMATLERHDVKEIVLGNGSEAQSGPVPQLLRAALDAQFPIHETVGDFQVRWRAGGTPDIGSPRPTTGTSLPLKTPTR